MLDSKLTLTGHLSILLNGEVIRAIPNLVVTAGKNYVISRMKDSTATPMSHMAIGTSSTAAAAGNTALGAEVARVALSSATITTNTITYVASYPAGTATGALTESAILNSASGGTMLCRTVFGVINKSSGDQMTISWVITVS